MIAASKIEMKFETLWLQKLAMFAGLSTRVAIGDETTRCYKDQPSGLLSFDIVCSDGYIDHWNTVTGLWCDQELYRASENWSGKVKRITFSNCKSPTVPKQFFKSFTTIPEIGVENSGVEAIASSDFPRDSIFRSLSLAHNKISELPEHLFANMPQVKYVDFSHNRINEIHPATFDDINQSLERLNLSHNRISSLDKEMFAKFEYLDHLDVSFNSVKFVHLDIGTMHALDLSYNGIRQLYDDSFENMSSLVFLSLNGNNLTKIERKTFAYSTNLNVLNISHNNFAEFDFGVVPSSLTAIDLNDNQLQVLVGWKESVLPALVMMQISNNAFTDQYLIEYFRDHPSLVRLVSGPDPVMKALATCSGLHVNVTSARREDQALLDLDEFKKNITNLLMQLSKDMNSLNQQLDKLGDKLAKGNEDTWRQLENSSNNFKSSIDQLKKTMGISFLVVGFIIHFLVLLLHFFGPALAKSHEF